MRTPVATKDGPPRHLISLINADGDVVTTAPDHIHPDGVLSEADLAALDRAVGQLQQGAQRWARLGLSERADLIERTHVSILANASRWVRAVAAAKGMPAGSWEGEEWMSGPYVVLANFGAVARELDLLATGRSSLDGLEIGTAPGGRITWKVLPADMRESILLHGFSAEVWMPPGITAEQVRATAGLGAKRAGADVGLVLGAGNVSSIGPLDTLYELVAHNRVSILKLNPTFAGLRPVLEDAFAPLIEFGALRIVNGGAAVGGYLTHHPAIVHVHITGSDVTHDAIVWGVGSDAQARRAAGTPHLTKEITSELGGVSPIIVVPGRWSKADLRYQAEHVATQRLHNGGHNCISGQALILSSDWDQRTEFLDALRDVLDTLPDRAPWYPGSERKMALAEDAYPAAEHRSGRLLVEVDESTSQELLTTEYFAPVLGHTALPGTGAAFLRAAVTFANDRLCGTLGASLIVAPADRAAMGRDFDSAIAELRYGTIGINVWSALGFLVPGLPWGAYPGHTLNAVGSGIGVVHNAHLIDGPERAVLSGPFRPFPRSIANGEFALSPKPSWFVTAESAVQTSRRLTAYSGRPSWLRVPGIIAAAFRA
ncbi:aldehyde dehydrogenase family protein [Nocardia sp. CA-151230]|uniref:aldehyde dehydrogenase family protein n=1 Tax=Nocardia sp. CA-151230 TaxID=3239982 RepID=UPI003D945B9F